MILIHSAGNSEIGIGNLSRCSKFIQTLRKQTDRNIVFFMECDNSLGEIFAVDNVENKIINSNLNSKLELLKMKNEIKMYNKPILVSDLLNLTYEDHLFYKELGLKKIIQINDSNIDKFKPDIVINGDGFVRPLTNSSNIKVYNGPQYIVLDSKIYLDRNVPLFRTRISKILVCFGGADPANYTETLVKYIYLNKKFRNIKFKVVIGPAVSNKRIEGLKNFEGANIEYIYKPSNLIKEIKASDLVITLGGLTTYEALALGKPVACLGWSYMDYYIKQLAENNLIYDLGSGAKDIKNLEQCINNIKKLKEISKKGYELLDGKAIERMVNIILEVN